MQKIKEYLSKSKLRSALILLILMLFSWYCFFGHKYNIIYNWGDSMSPTYKHKEVLVVQHIDKLENWIPNREEVVIIKTDEERLLKRIMALPKDTVEIKKGVI